MKRLALLLLPALAACLPERYSGLLPVSPVIERDARPVLEWEDVRSALGPAVEVDDVRYDLRIFSNSTTVYSRDGLDVCRHRVEVDLGGHFYTWTVRARFTVAGRERVTQWTHATGGDHWIEPDAMAVRRSAIPLEIRP